MKWEELIAEARAAGVLKFCADGIAVLQQVPTHHVPPSESSQRPSRKIGSEGREGGNGKSEGEKQGAGS
jgi:hypothetical protein